MSAKDKELSKSYQKAKAKAEKVKFLMAAFSQQVLISTPIPTLALCELLCFLAWFESTRHPDNDADALASAVELC